MPPPHPTPRFSLDVCSILTEDGAFTPIARGHWPPLQLPGTYKGGGRILVILDSEDWASTPSYVISFTVPRLSAALGSSP